MSSFRDTLSENGSSTNQLKEGLLIEAYSSPGSMSPELNEASNALASMSGGSHVRTTDRERWLIQARIHAKHAAEK